MVNERIALGLPSLAGYEPLDALGTASALGFQAVMSLPGGPRTEHSLGAFPTFEWYAADDDRRRTIRDALRGFSHVALHQAWDNRWSAWVDCAAYYGAGTVTVHAGRPTGDETQAHFLRRRVAELRRIGDYAGAKGIMVGVENEGGQVEDYLALIEAVAHPVVGATLDVGHCAYFDSVRSIEDVEARVVRLNETLCAIVGALASKLVSLHVHDVRRDDWRDHRQVGSGVVNYPALFAALVRVGYRGLFEIELEEPDRERAAAATGAYLTGLLPATGVTSRD